MAQMFTAGDSCRTEIQNGNETLEPIPTAVVELNDGFAVLIEGVVSDSVSERIQLCVELHYSYSI